MMVGWAPFDPLEWEPPQWESLRSVGPWQARVPVCRFRKVLVDSGEVVGEEPSVGFEEMEMMLARVKTDVNHDLVWNVFSGDYFPPFPVFLPLGCFGCRKVPPPEEEEVGDKAAAALLGEVAAADPSSLVEGLSALSVVDEVGPEEKEGDRCPDRPGGDNNGRYPADLRAMMMMDAQYTHPAADRSML